jgi:hypothetical protein
MRRLGYLHRVWPNKCFEPTRSEQRAAQTWRSAEDKESTAMHRGLCTLLLLVLAASTAHARGPFAAEGTIGDLGISGDSITFRMLGAARLKHMNALPEDARRKSQQTLWFSVDIIARIRFAGATQGAKRSGDPEAANAYDQLRKLLDDEEADAIRIAIDDPSLTFSNDGELTRVNGTGIHAHSVRINVVVD